MTGSPYGLPWQMTNTGRKKNNEKHFSHTISRNPTRNAFEEKEAQPKAKTARE